MIKSYIEVSPLSERHWTGIPTVTAGLVECALGDPDLEWGFLYENIVVNRASIIEALRVRSGEHFLADVERRVWDGETMSTDDMKEAVCVYTNLKAVRRQFAREALIVHDLSVVLTPDFHNVDTINHHANRLRGDVASTDFFFCVSHATMMDLRSYFAVPAAAAAVMPMGLTIDLTVLTDLLREREGVQCEPYVCVLGTIEPRKNARIVMDFLRENPRFSQKYRFVFVGRDGWNDEKKNILEALDRGNIDRSRVLFSGFLSEKTKLRLLLSSRFCVYPSFFEGFGIPIAEAAALRKYIVCSDSSSMTEVAPEMSFFFDPTDVFSFGDAFLKAERASELTWHDRIGFSDIAPRVAARDWGRGYRMLRDWVLTGNPTGVLA